MRDPIKLLHFFLLVGLLLFIGRHVSLSYGETVYLDTEPPEQPPPNVLKARLSKTQDLCLTLPQALQMAQENNPNYKASLSMVKQARAAYLTTWANLLPDFSAAIFWAKIDATLPANETFSRIPGASSNIRINNMTFAPFVRFNYPVIQGGTKIFSILAARKTLAAQKEQANLTLEQTLQQTAEAFYSLQKELDQIAIYQKQIQEAQEQLRINQARLETGAGTNLDVMQSQSQLLQAQQQLLTAYQAAESQASWLNELLSLPAIIAVIPQEPVLTAHTLVPSTKTFQELLAIAHQNRPEVKRLQAQIAALGQTRNKIVAEYLPNLTLQYVTGAIGTNANDTQHLEVASLQAGINVKNMGVSGVTRLMEDTAKIQEQRHRLQAQLNAIDKSLSDAYMQSVTTWSRIDVAENQIATAERALSDAIERLKAGVGRNIDVTDAETRLTEARSDLSSAILDYNLAQVNLVFNLGLASVQTLTQGIPCP